jgi:hypothetical protein
MTDQLKVQPVMAVYGWGKRIQNGVLPSQAAELSYGWTCGQPTAPPGILAMLVDRPPLSNRGLVAAPTRLGSSPSLSCSYQGSDE